MPSLTIGFGLLLMLISISTYVGAEGQEATAFAPAVLGLLIVGCGVASMIKKELRMHLMHGAVLIALIGVIYPVIRLVQFMFPLNADSMTVTRNILIPVACGLYLYFAIQSFRTARRNRKANSQTTSPPDRVEATDVA